MKKLLSKRSIKKLLLSVTTLLVFTMTLSYFTISAQTDVSNYEKILNSRLLSGIEYAKVGDVTEDDVSDLRDLVRIKKLISELSIDGDGDLNGDGVIDSNDMAFLRIFLMNYDSNAVFNFDNEVEDNWTF